MRTFTKMCVRRGRAHGMPIVEYFGWVGCRAALLASFAAVGTAACAGADETLGSEREAVLLSADTGNELPGLTTQQEAAFLAGRDAFAEVEALADGIGPVFNERACGNCHTVGAIGGAGTQFEVRAGRVVGGTFNSLVSEGGQLFDLFSVTSLSHSERQAIPNCTLPPNGEPVPADATVVAQRRTTALFGLGFVDATPDQTFINLAASEPQAIRGHVNVVTNLDTGGTSVGKFGWKAQVPTLHQFSGDAYLNEMGITNPEFPNEQAPSGNASLIAACDLVPGLEDDGEDVGLFTDFMTFLAPIAPKSMSAAAQAGDLLFTQIGCDGCHVRTLTAGSSPVAAINNHQYHPFSDFLLHDMGSLGDGIGDNGTATTTEMRTAPLWGVHLVNPKDLLHDGRATSLADAILRHDGQARAARDAFAALSSTDRDRVLAFLNSL